MQGSNHIAKKILLLIVLVAGINGLLSWVYYNKYAYKKPYFKLDRNFEKSKNTVNTLILGHSRAAFGINDSILENSFNYATYGENNVYTYYKLAHIVKHCPGKIKRIIIPMGRSTFFSNSRPNMADHSYWNQYLDYTQLGAWHEDISGYYSVWFQSIITPYARMLRSEINKKEEGYKQEKIKLSDLTTMNQKFKLALNSVSHNFETRNYYDNISLAYLNRLLILCANENIEVIPVRFPVTSYYNEAFNSKMKHRVLYERPFNLSFKNHGIEIWDETNFFANDESKFKDVHHLTPEASIEFTQYLKKKLN